MRDKNRIDNVLSSIKDVWEQNPDLRLCQLIANLVGDNNYNIEDDVLIEKLKRKNISSKSYIFNNEENSNTILTIQPNYLCPEGYRATYFAPIAIGLCNNDNDLIIGVSKERAKEIISTLQEIVNCIEDE